VEFEGCRILRGGVVFCKSGCSVSGGLCQAAVEEMEMSAEQEQEQATKRWFVLKVQSNREEDVRDGLLRQLKLEKAEDMVGEILVPTESVSEVRAGRREVVQRKLYPGYVIIQVQVDEHGRVPEKLWYLIRSTSGVGDFIGGEHPWPLREEEVAQMLGKAEQKEEEVPRLEIDFKEGDMVEIKEGSFRSMKGRVEEVNPATGRVKVLIHIFGRATSVELEYWQVEPI